eukprot:7377030-Prymnesium_polylepis.1
MPAGPHRHASANARTRVRMPTMCRLVSAWRPIYHERQRSLTWPRRTDQHRRVRVVCRRARGGRALPQLRPLPRSQAAARLLLQRGVPAAPLAGAQEMAQGAQASRRGGSPLRLGESSAKRVRHMAESSGSEYDRQRAQMCTGLDAAGRGQQPQGDQALGECHRAGARVEWGVRCPDHLPFTQWQRCAGRTAAPTGCRAR